MIENGPHSYDYESYRLLPKEDRWLLNKLMIAEKQGLKCGPVGVPPPEGTYCVRPIMNLTGNGNPGFYKHKVGPNGLWNDLSHLPGGYFWCEWIDAPHYGYDFENDVLKRVTVSKRTQDDEVVEIVDDPSIKLILPPWLRGKMKYMSVETLGDTIIEVNPRWQWDMTGMRRITNSDGSFRWEHLGA